MGDAVGKLMDPNVPAFLMSSVKESDARAACNALVDFTQVVKANPISASTPASSVSGSAASSISAAADKLSAAAYPFIKDIDWTSDLYSKPIPGANPQQVTKAIGKIISMGAAMDGASLKEAANAHVTLLGAWTGEACCLSQISQPSTRALGRRSRLYPPPRGWTCTTQWLRLSGIRAFRTSCFPL